jgi:hypothetical protein
MNTKNERIVDLKGHGFSHAAKPQNQRAFRPWGMHSAKPPPYFGFFPNRYLALVDALKS